MIVFLKILMVVLVLVALVFLYKKGYFDALYMLHRKAYFRYRAEVATHRKTYSRYVDDFKSANAFISADSIANLNMQHRNISIVVTLLTEHPDLVEQYFSQTHFTHKDYLELKHLFDTTELATPAKEEMKITPKVTNLVPNDNPFDSRLEDWQLDILTKCINETAIFNATITTDDLKSILACNPNIILKSKNNRLLAYLFQHLAARNYITDNWQAVISTYQLFKAPQKDDFLTASDLSTANDNVKNVLPKKSEVVDRCIKEMKKQ